MHRPAMPCAALNPVIAAGATKTSSTPERIDVDRIEASSTCPAKNVVDDDDDEGVPYLALTSPSTALATLTTIVIRHR